MDSGEGYEVGCNDFLELVQYLNGQYPEARFVINKLIPRTRTKYAELKIFEERRIAFNKYLEENLTFLKNYVLVDHVAFEEGDKYVMLSDGVHISPLVGVPMYVDTIKGHIQ